MNDISKDTDLVSVIVPVYNTAPYVDHCLKSILDQTYGNLEIIVVNDGSTDNSAQVLAAYADNPKVKVLTRENGGLSAARNTGMEAATGEWVMFVDSDDTIHPELVERVLTAARGRQIDFVRYGYRYVELAQQFDFEPFNPSAPIKFFSDPAGYFLDHGLHPSACVICFRRSSLNGLKFEPGLIYEDLDFTWRYLCNASAGIHIPWAAYNYVQIPGSIIHSPLSRRKLESIDRILRRLAAIYLSAGVLRLRTLKHKLLAIQVKKLILKPCFIKHEVQDSDILALAGTVAGKLLADGIIGYIDFSPRWWKILLKVRLQAKSFWALAMDIERMLPWRNLWWWPKWKVPSFLMLHSVRDDVIDPESANNTIRPGELKDLIIALRRQGYEFKTFKEAIESGDCHTMCLTFDDGYVDNYRTLFPMLKDLNCPATCFVTNRGQDDDKFLSAAMIREMEQSGLVEIGGHTANHTMLTEVPLDMAREEIFGNKAWLESVLGHPIDSFCYPRGGENDDIVGLVKAAGYRYAAAMVKKMRPVAADLYRIHRQIIPRGMATWKAVLLATRGKWKL